MHTVKSADGLVHHDSIATLKDTKFHGGHTKNWIAICVPNEKKKGGLDRTFFERSSIGREFYCLPDLNCGDILEVGSDRRDRHREYAVVVETQGADTVTLNGGYATFRDAKSGKTPPATQKTTSIVHVPMTRDQARALFVAAKLGEKEALQRENFKHGDLIEALGILTATFSQQKAAA